MPRTLLSLSNYYNVVQLESEYFEKEKNTQLKVTITNVVTYNIKNIASGD